MNSELIRGIAVLNMDADPAFMPVDPVEAEADRLAPILSRYDDILAKLSPAVREEPDPGTSPAHLRWMIRVLQGYAASPAGGRLTPLKMHRWLGFIQGTMIAHGVLSVPQERELTRQYLTEH